jgi:hypothetical protein
MVYRMSFKCLLRGLQITDPLFKSNLIFALFVFLLCRLKNGALTIDSSTPTMRRNLNEPPIFIKCKQK